jgi:CDP-diacylglycerol--glycerol-3-phosphate 3-phosphatidyltransferase
MNIANKISLFRILNVPFFVASLVYYSNEKDFLRYVALSIFCLAVLSDTLDGFLARKTKQKSKAGLVLDPLADKLLLMSAFICLSFDKFVLKFPSWVTLIVISRDAIILLGATLIYILKNNLEIYPSRWGKLTTVFQMVAVICLLLRLEFSPIFWSLAIFFTLISGIDYIHKGFKVLYGKDNHG